MMVMLLLLIESQPLFNIVANEGRSLYFLAQSPVSRWQVMVGKNLAYGSCFLVFNAVFLALCCLVCGTTKDFGLYLVISSLVLVMLLGVGNLVSVLLPTAWIGARGAAGGSSAARAATDGGVEEPGCFTSLLKMLCLQGLYLLAVPPTVLVAFGPRFLGDGGHFIVAVAVIAYTALVYLFATSLALWRLAGAEERILLRFATRSAV
jgi:hypothetical protein